MTNETYLAEEHDVSAPPHSSFRLVPQDRQCVAIEQVLYDQYNYPNDHSHSEQQKNTWSKMKYLNYYSWKKLLGFGVPVVYLFSNIGDFNVSNRETQ